MMKLAGLRTSRIARIFATGLVLSIIAGTVVFIWTLRLQEIGKWEKQADTYSVVLAENTSQQMDFAYSAITSIAERIQDRWSVSADYLSAKLATYDFHLFLKDKVELFPAIDVISVLDVNGNTISTSRQFPAPEYSLYDRDYFLMQRDNPTLGIYLSNPVRSKSTGKWMFFLSYRLNGSDGEFIGVVILGLSPEFYANFYEKLSMSGRATISLMRTDFTYLARWPENDAVMGEKNTTGSAFQLIHDKNQRSGVIVSDGAAQTEQKATTTQMVAVQSLEKYPLILSFAVDEDFYLEDWKKTSFSIACVAVGAVIAVIIAFYMLINLFLQRERDMQVMTDLKRDADKINLKQNELLINLTEQQKAIKESSDRLQAIFQNAADGIVMVDETGQVEAMNPVAIELFGFAEMHAENVDALRMAFPGQAELLANAMKESDFLTSGRVRLEAETTRLDGTPFPAEFSISEYTLAGKRKLIIIVRDISERRKIERMKNEFISTVSHELRTPLTAIRGALGLLGGGAVAGLPPAMMPLLNIAQKNSESLTRLINDLLDLQKMEAGKMEFIYEDCALFPLLEMAIQQNQALAQSMSVELVMDTDAGMSADSLQERWLSVDTGRFQQVMANLISNACKFSPEGSQVRVYALAWADQMIRIIVADSGPGIPENFQERIFKKFSQADASDTRSQSGTGLGLAISKMIVRQLHGDIGFYNATPAEGGGARFYVDLPLVIPPDLR